MFEKLQDLEKKYQKLQEQLLEPNVLKNHQLIAKYAKEAKDLEEVMNKYYDYQKISEEINGAKELLINENEDEMIKMLEDIIVTNQNKLTTLEQELKILLLPKDENDGKNAIMEIRGAAGGDEANIFAGDLFKMYTKYFEIIGFDYEILEMNSTESGGFTKLSLLVKGENVFSKLKFESGSHRVQRVPITETQGRVHTSTATVIVMPEVEDVEIDLQENDLRVDVFRSSGAGGQSVNTTDSAVRITHIKTNIVVTCQTERSQIKNKERAMKVMRSKLYDYYLQEQNQTNDSERKNKLGTGSRSEKIRTYNYPQNRVTDHRIGLTLNKLDQIMQGKIDEIVDGLAIEYQMQRLKEIE